MKIPSRKPKNLCAMKILSIEKVLAYFLISVCMVLLNVPVLAQDKVIKMGSVIYPDNLLVALVGKKFLEEQGHQVELTRFSEQGILFAALNKGDITIANSQIDYVTHEHWKRYNRKLEKLSIVSHGNYQCLVVPAWLPIDSIENLSEIAKEVGNKIIGIETGSGLYRETEAAIKAYGLNYTLVPGSTPAMIAQLQSAMERKEAIVTMLWNTSWMMQRFDVKFLKDPKGIFAPPQPRYWIAQKSFSAQEPNIREALASVYVPIEDIQIMSRWLLDGLTLEQAVDSWYQQNSDLIQRWQQMSSR